MHCCSICDVKLKKSNNKNLFTEKINKVKIYTHPPIQLSNNQFSTRWEVVYPEKLYPKWKSNGDQSRPQLMVLVKDDDSGMC